MFGGGCIESAAYNPSISPFHAAYINAVASSGGDMDPSEIQEVVLAEIKGAPVVHRNNVKLLLRAVAPNAKLTLLPLQTAPFVGGKYISSNGDAGLL